MKARRPSGISPEADDRQAADATIVAIDFETTGTVAGFPDEPWQIGMVAVVKGSIVIESAYDRLLRVGDRPFAPSAPGRHHALRDEIRKAPGLPELWPDLQAWWTRYPLAAHNVATERKVMQKAAPLHRYGPWIDTLKLSRMTFPDAPSHALGDMLALTGLTGRVCELVPGRTVHDALFDAVGSAVLLEYFIGLPEWSGLTVNDLVHAGRT